MANLPELSISFVSRPVDGAAPEGPRVPQFNNWQIRPDGSFVFNGIRPGRVRIGLNSFYGPKGFTLVRVERDGLEQEEIEVTPGASITGVRLVFAHGTAVVRGQIKAENGALPTDGLTAIRVYRTGKEDQPVARANADIRGRFTVQGLAAGDYIFEVRTVLPATGGSGRRRSTTARKQVTVPASGEIEIVIPIDMSGSNNNRQ